MHEMSVSFVSYESLEAAMSGAYGQALSGLGRAKEVHIFVEGVSQEGREFRVSLRVQYVLDEELEEKFEHEREEDLERVHEEVLRHERILEKEGEIDEEHLAQIRAMLGPHAALEAEMIMHDFAAAEHIPSTPLDYEAGFHPEPAGIHYHDVPKPDYQLPWLYPEAGLQHKIRAPDRELIPV